MVISEVSLAIVLLFAAVPPAQILAQLQDLGIHIVIDDFGTGYSSLAYLQQFPVDSLKIDRSFISGMGKSPEGDSLIHTLIQLGKALNLETLAEGIEEDGQLAQLRGEKCDVGQGYLFARPVAPEEIEQYFSRSTLTVLEGLVSSGASPVVPVYA